MRSLLHRLTGASEEYLAEPFAFLGLPWPADSAAVGLGPAGGALEIEAVLGFDPVMLPEHALRVARLEPTGWLPADALPEETYFLWTWRAPDGWHLANLFATLADASGESLRDESVRREIYNAVEGRIGRHFTGDYAALAMPQQTKDRGGGYPAVAWIFRIDDAASLRREMLGSALRWATGVRVEGGPPLEYPYLEEASHEGRRLYLLRGPFVHLGHGYDPCFWVADGMLVCSTSSSGLRRIIDAAAGRSPRMRTPEPPGAGAKRSFFVYAARPASMRQLSNLYDFQVELYRRRSLSAEEALTDTTDYRLRYEVFEGLARLVDHVAIAGRYEADGRLRLWARVVPAAGAAE